MDKCKNCEKDLGPRAFNGKCESCHWETFNGSESEKEAAKRKYTSLALSRRCLRCKGKGMSTGCEWCGRKS